MAWIFIIIGVVAVIGGIMYLMFYHEKDTNSTVERTQKLSQDKYDPNMTRFSAKKEAKASAARDELLTNVNYEVGQLTKTIEAEAEALKAGYRKDQAFSEFSMEREQQLADHQAYLALADNKTVVARIASESGLDPETMRELILEEAKTRREVMLEEVKLRTQLTFKEQEMEIDVEKARRLKQVDFEFENKMAGLDKQMAEVKHLLPQHLINALSNQLSAVHYEYEQVKLLDDGEFKEREIKRVERNMKALEKNIRERQKNL